MPIVDRPGCLVLHEFVAEEIASPVEHRFRRRCRRLALRNEQFHRIRTCVQATRIRIDQFLSRRKFRDTCTARGLHHGICELFRHKGSGIALGDRRQPIRTHDYLQGLVIRHT